MESLSRIKLYQQMLKRQLLPATFVFIVVLAITVLGISFRKPNYLAEGTLKFERTSPISSLTGVGKEIGNLDPLVEKSSPVATESEVIRSTPVIQDTITQLDLRDRKGTPLKPKKFLKRLTVAEVRGADILKISYKDPNARNAATVVNTLMDAYLKRNTLTRQKQAASALKFIEQELPAASAAVNQEEKNLQQFKKEHQIVALDKEITTAVSIQADLRKQITEVQAQIVDSKTQAQIFQNKLGISPQEAINRTVISQSPGVQEVLVQIQQVESQLAVEHNRSHDDSPLITSLEGKLSQLEGLLRKRIARVLGRPVKELPSNLQLGMFQQNSIQKMVDLEAMQKGLEDRLATLKKSQAAYRRQMDALPGLEKEQRELEYKLEAAQVNYSQLLQKRGELQVAKKQNIENVTIVAPAQAPGTPISSLNLYVASVVLSLFAAVATVWWLEVRDRSIKTITTGSGV